MQATGTATAANQPRQNEFDVSGKVRYLWCARRYDVRGREIGHLFLEPKQFIQITDKLGRALDMSQEAFVRKDSNSDGLITTVKTSMKIVDELLSTYGDQGLVYLAALDNLPQAVVIRIEQLLLPDREMKLPAIQQHLQGMTATPTGLADYARQYHETRTALLAGVEQAIAWCNETVVAARNEYEGRMRGEVGQAFYTPQQKAIAAEIGQDLKEGQNINVENTGGNGDIALLANAMTSAMTQMAQSNSAMMQSLLQQQQQTNALLMQMITGKPLPPSAITNPDVEGEGEPLPDGFEAEETIEAPAPVAASVQPPKPRKR